MSTSNVNAHVTFNKWFSDKQVTPKKIREPITYSLTGYSPVDKIKRGRLGRAFPGEVSIYSLSEVDG